MAGEAQTVALSVGIGYGLRVGSVGNGPSYFALFLAFLHSFSVDEFMGGAGQFVGHVCSSGLVGFDTFSGDSAGVCRVGRTVGAVAE